MPMPFDEVVLYHHDDYTLDTQTPGHPESPDRVMAILGMIDKLGLPVKICKPEMVDPADLLAVHGEHHIERIRDFGVGYMDPDTYHHERTFDMSLRAAGGVVEAMERSYKERKPVFTIPRPPGHHAGSDYNMGFCYFNNVALAAKMAINILDDVEKVAIIDIDAHHGNGTNDIFAEDPDVLYISTHQWGIFPGTGHHRDVGKGPGEGKNVNLPFMGGSGDPSFKAAMEDIIAPITREYSPDMMFISFGGDSHLMDPLTSLTLSTPGYLDMTRSLKELGEELVSNRIVFELEGGYHPHSLAEIFAGTMDMYTDEPKGIDSRYVNTSEAMPDNVRLKQFMNVQSSYWKI